MKKKFLKVFSVFLVLISLFSALSTEAVKYTITLSYEEETYFIYVQGKERNNVKLKLKYDQKLEQYKKFFNNKLSSQEIDTQNIKENSIRQKVERALSRNTKKIDNFETIEAILKQLTFNKTMVAYIDQQERAAGRIECKYVAQKVTSLIPSIFKLPTPFGEAEMEFRHGSEGYYDVFIKDTISTDYEYLCMVIDAFVKNKKEFAKIIQKYLELKYNSSEYDGKNLVDTLKQMKTDVQKNIKYDVGKFFENEDNFVENKIIVEKIRPRSSKDKNKSDRAIIKKFKDSYHCYMNKLNYLNNQREIIEKIRKNPDSNLENIDLELGIKVSKKTLDNKKPEIEKKLKEYEEKLQQSETGNIEKFKNELAEKRNEILKNIVKERLETVANALSAVLFVSEAGPNRAGDGGKSARSPLKYIIDDKYKEKNYSFCNVFVDDNGKGPLYPVAVKKGTEIARMLRSQGEKHNTHSKKQRKNKGKDYCKFEENFSDDEKETVEETKEKIVEKNRIEVQNEFNKWIKSADPEQIEEFTKWLNSRMDKK